MMYDSIFSSLHVVFDRCEYESGGVTFSSRHGDFYLDPESCQLCLCDDGVGVMCEDAGTCSFLRSSLSMRPEDCEVEGRVIGHGETVQVSLRLFLSLYNYFSQNVA